MMKTKKYLFLLAFIISCSLPSVGAQTYDAFPPSPSEKIGTTATGGTIGATPTTAGGTPMGATIGPLGEGGAVPTASGGTVGATAVPLENVDVGVGANECIALPGQGQLCGVDALRFCTQYAKALECVEFLAKQEAKKMPR